MILAVLWVLGSIYNIYVGLNGIITDLGVLPYLSDPATHEWFRFGLPAEIMIAFFVLAFGFLTLLVVYGLFTAKSWSYNPALAIPIFILILNVALVMLYSSAPSELGLGAAASDVIPSIFGNIVALVFTWGYLMQTHVKQYLNKIPTPPPEAVSVSPSALPLPPPPPTVFVTMSTEKKFCRYCGAENKTDADFCEKCGKKIG